MGISSVLSYDCKMFSSFIAALALSTVEPKSRAERTFYRETSTYADVVQFLETVESQNSTAKLNYIGKSFEGRPIPLMTVAEPMVTNAEQARKSGKLLIYLQANIHAGEVEGKEATLHMLRRFVKNHELLKKVIFLVQPIYNSDGNEKFGPQARNRPGQNGPESVGLRPNGQNYDLNRDCVKAESPEMQAALKHVYSWNPHVVFDLHTTDGTRHGYPLTYGGPNHPNTYKPLYDYSFDELFPTVRKDLRSKFQLEVFDYGNGVIEKDQWRFETFAAEPRYVTNYGGLRNAVTILSEAMVYEPFENRVRDTERFVESCLTKLINDKSKIMTLTSMAATSYETAPRAATYKLKNRGTEDVLMEKNLAKGERRSGPIRDIETLKMPVYDKFEAATTEVAPVAYIVPKNEKITQLLALHGIQVQELIEKQAAIGLQSFHVDEFKQAVSPFQGHKLISLKGGWRTSTEQIDGLYISMKQPLHRLIFDLFEPQCEDGITSWGFLGESFPTGTTHPVRRLLISNNLKLKPANARP